MAKRLVLLLVVWLAVQGIARAAPCNPADFAPGDARFTHGPIVGAVGARSARIGFRTDVSACVQVRYAPVLDPLAAVTSEPVLTRGAEDFTGQVTVSALAPDTVYAYTIVVNGVETSFPEMPHFKTFPPPLAGDAFSFGVLSDLNGNAPAPAMGALAEDNPDFVVILGDYDHRNPRTLEEMRAMHREVREEAASGPDLRDHVLRRFPVAHVWDDHDYGTNDSDKTFAAKADALKAFDEYWPTYDRPNAANGIWHKFRYGSLAEIYMLDLRYQRDPNADPDNAKKSMLDGDNIANGQEAWLMDNLRASPATWKFIASTVSWNPTVDKPDAWHGYQTEQKKLVDFIRKNAITGVIFCSGDIHTGGAIDDGTNAIFPEISVAHTNNHSENTTCGGNIQCGGWTQGWDPGGGGYGLITVSRNTVLMEARDEAGSVRYSLTVASSAGPGVSIIPTSGLETSESGDTAVFSAVLNAQPIHKVTIGLSSTDTGEGTVAPAGLTFTASNWNQPQTVTVSGVSDSVNDGDAAYTIVTAPVVSNDPLYNGLDPDDVSVINRNNALPVARDDSASVYEGENVTIDLARNDSDADTGLDTGSILVVSAPAHGAVTVNSDGTVDYVETAGGVARDSFSYTISDVSGAPSNVATVTVTITGIRPLDSNGDGIPDVTAIGLGLDPTAANGDTDGDGQPDAIEVGSDPNAPLDSDSDGVIDALEPGEAARNAAVASRLRLAGGQTVTVTTAAGESLSGLSAAPAAGAPAGDSFPFGTVSYTTTSPLAGQVVVRMAFSAALPADLVLYKVDRAGMYTRLPGSVWQQVDARTVDVTLTDGDSQTDLDGIANGSIEDPLAPAGAPSAAIALDAGGSGGGGCALNAVAAPDPLLPLLILAGTACLLYRGRYRFWMKAPSVILAAWPGVAAAAQEWLPVQDIDLSVQSGSVLDLSFLVPSAPAGAHGRVVVRDGGFAFEDGRPQRFLCASKPLGPYSSDDLPDYQAIDRYVHQLRLHGYNLARMALIENALMRGRSQDLDFDPVQLDRFRYLLAALKREGIYWLLYGMTSPNGAYASGSANVKQGVYYDPAMQAHWRALVGKLYGTVNPYTGQTPLEDPALAGFILVNEGGVGFVFRNSTELPAGLKAQFIEWLKGQYRDTTTLSRSWTLAPHESLEQGVIDLPATGDRSQRMADLQRFYLSMEESTLAWMSDYLRALGYQGLISGYNNRILLEAQASRARLDWVDMHRYHDYPTGFGAPGSSFRQTSSLTSAAQYIQDLALSRYGDRPYTVTEYGQLFWNSWRRESGVVAPSYAGLQGWHMICRMASSPIELSYGNLTGKRKDAIYPYSVGLDPVDRAGETLAALLFLRGDVKPAQSRLGIDLTPAFVNASAGLGRIPESVRELSLITGTGLHWSENAWLWTPDARISLDQTLPVDQKTIGYTRQTFAELLSTLKERQLIGADNPTDPQRGIFQSDTGQLTLETSERRFSVVTARTEALSFDRQPLQLNNLTVESADGPALVAVSSVDHRPLATSRRILVILATDALNSGMTFTDNSRRTLQDIGTLPVVMRTARVTVRLRHDRASPLVLYALALNGERVQSVPLQPVPDGVRFTLDTASLAHGPTTYFELVDPEQQTYDSNGDGIYDADAIALGLDPTNPQGDTDGDGRRDAWEVGEDVDNPVDKDVDGIIDALEPGNDAENATVASGLRLANGDSVSLTGAAGVRLSKVRSAAVRGGPADVNFPFGMISYATTSPPGGSVTVLMEFSSDLPRGLSLYKVDRAGGYTALPAGTWMQVDSRTISITAMDGDPLTDLDGMVNGSTEDPVAPGVVLTAAGEGGSSGSGGCVLGVAPARDVLLTLMILAATAGLPCWRVWLGKDNGRQCDGPGQFV